MIIDKSFRIAFLLSIGLHSILFSPLLDFSSQPNIKDDTKIEVTYIQIKEEKSQDAAPLHIEDVKVSLQKERITAPKENNRLDNKKREKIDTAKKDVDKKARLKKKVVEEAVLDKNTIDLNSVSLYDGTSESLNYLRVVRNKINRYVHKNYSSYMGEGEALLYFVLSPDGSVQSASITKDNMHDNERLKKLCLDSIYLSSPFKSFPEDLDLPYAAFNISISFKKR